MWEIDCFRKVPKGVDVVREYIGRPLSGVPDPWDCHLSGPSTSRSLARRCTPWGSRWRRSPRPSATSRASTRAGAPRRQHATTSRACWRVPDEEGSPEPVSDRRPRRSRTPSPTTRTSRAAPSWSVPVQAVLPHLPARHGHDHGVRRRDNRRRPTPATAGTRTPPTWPRRTRASWCGRPTGRCAGPSSTSTSSRPAWTTPRPARPSRSATSWWRRSSGWSGRPGSATASSGFAGVQKMSSSAGGAPTAEDALRRAGGADPALALRAPQPQADLRHRLRPRGGPAVRRVGLADPQGRRPREARQPGAGLGAGRRDRVRAAAGAARRRTLPAAVLGRRRDRRLGRADQPDRRRGGRRPPATPRAGDGLDHRVRRPGRPHQRARDARRGDPGGRVRRRAEWLRLLRDGLAEPLGSRP